MAAGRPVVATAVDGTTEVVLDGKTGLTIPSGDSVALAAAISRMLAAPQLVRTLGNTGREFVLEHFTHERQVQQTESLYLDAWHRSRVSGLAMSQAPVAVAHQETFAQQSK